MIKLPTRITKSSSTIIDHMYSTRSDVMSDVHVPALCISDHFPICFTRNTNKIKMKKHQHQTIMYRCFKTFSESHFLTDLSKLHIELVESVSNPNEALEMFFSVLNTVLTKHAPIKEKRVKYSSQPAWFNSDIKEAILKRDNLHKNKHFDAYKIQRNKVSSMLKHSKKNFYNDAIKENKSPSFLWKKINNITCSSKSRQGLTIPDIIKVENSNISGCPNILNEFLILLKKLRSLQTISQNFNIISMRH